MKTALYIRVSTDLQSFDSQKSELLEYCSKRGWFPTIFEDQMSGAKSNRPGLESLMSEVRSGKITRLICFKLDRLGRSLAHMALILSELQSHNVSLIIPSQGIDTSSTNPAAQLQINILMAVAQFEREIIRERVIAGQIAAKRNGTHLGRKASHSITLPQIHALKSSGLSLRAISRQLNVSLSSIQHVISYAP